MELGTDDLIQGLILAALGVGALAYLLLIRRRQREADASRVDAATAETVRRRAVSRFRHLARWDVAGPEDPDGS